MRAGWTIRWLSIPLALATVACGSSSTTTPGFVELSGTGGATSASTVATSTATVGSTSSGAGATDDPGLGAPYPIVLAHGFFGFDDFAGAGFLTYFYGVKDHLAANGETSVFTPEVDPFNDSTFRGAQLAAHVDAILEQTGHRKVILIGHSQGGLDARVVAHDHPDKVAAVVTIATPHQGSRIADVALGIVDDGNLQGVLDFVIDAVGKPLYDQAGDETDVALGLGQFSSPGIAAFNDAYPNQPGVFYASLAGRTDWHDGGTHCQGKAPDFVFDFLDERDAVDPLLSIPEAILDGGLGDPFPNDGLVRAQDARWGEFWGCLPADHLDQVGQLFGDGPGLGNDWDHEAFFVDLVRFLRTKGY